MKENIKLHHNTIGTITEMELWDGRLLNCALVGHSQEVTFNSKERYGVDIHRYAALMGTPSHIRRAYEYALASAIKLRDTPITIKLATGYTLRTSIIFELDYNEETKTIFIHWNRDFIPLISGTMDKGKFMYPSVTMVEIPIKRYRLYLLLEKHLWKLSRDGEIRLTKREIQEVAHLDAKSYERWSNVTSRIIKPTLHDMKTRLYKNLTSRVEGGEVIFTEEIECSN